MASYSATQNSITVSWSSFGESGNIANYYSIELYYGYSATGTPVDYEYNISNSSRSKTFSGLSPGTAYYVKLWARMQNGTNKIEYLQVYTQSPPAVIVGNMGYIYMNTSTTTPGQISFSWDAVSNATSYVVRLHRGIGPYNFIRSDTVYSTSYSYSGLDENTTYTVEIYGQRSGSSPGGSNWNYTTTYSFNVGPLPSITVEADTAIKGRMNVWWTSATNATSYGVEIYRGNTTDPAYLVESKTVTGNSTFFTGLAESTGYTVKVYGKRANYPNGTALTDYKVTKDFTAPVLSNVTGDGNGRAYLSWSASDAGVGLRDTNRYYTSISDANGTTHGNGGYSNNTFRTFTQDGAGNNLVHDAWYYMTVVAYDKDNNNTSQTVRVQYKTARPINWEWWTPKVKGQDINLTADEWNSFCTKINQFRLYKSLVNYDFTPAQKGQNIRAVQGNQARAAILGMITSGVPASVSAGQNIEAAFFNGLRNSLNSIT